MGNSRGLRLPKQILEVREKKLDLAKLVARMPRGYRGSEDTFGPARWQGVQVVALYIPHRGGFVSLTFDPPR